MILNLCYVSFWQLIQGWSSCRAHLSFKRDMDFLSFATKGINNQIEQAILRADKIGVKVISLAPLLKEKCLDVFLENALEASDP
ncbi:hypothetical protein AAZV13_13G251600 [Glycine max]